MQQVSKDIIIVGASLAGSCLALKLAQAGRNVAIIDKTKFPRSKACGEGLSARGLQILADLGLSSEIKNLPQTKISGISVWKSNRPIDVAGGSPGSVIGIERNHLDQLLNQKICQNSKISAFYQKNIRKVTYDDSDKTYSVDFADQKISAPIIVFATGASSNLAENCEIKTKKKISKRYGATLRFEGEYLNNLKQVQVIVLPRHEIYCTPIGQNRINCSILGDKSLISQIEQKSFHDFLSSELLKKLKFKVSSLESTHATGPIGRYKRPFGNQGAFCIGDCAEQLDPIGGMGMTHALVSASILNDQLIDFWAGKLSLKQAQLSYSKKRSQAIKELRGFTTLANFCLRKLPSYQIAKVILQSEFSRTIGNIAHTGHRVSSLSGNLGAFFISFIGSL